MQPNARYASYLLRLRQVRSGDQATWLASVQDIANGGQHLFPNVEALVTFLLAEFGGSVPASGKTGEPNREDDGPAEYITP